MIEPWVTPWSNLVYTRLHHEPFDSHAETWELPPGDPLTIANGALPWLIFNRDRHRFESEFPQLEILEVEPFMPFRYLLSGGISYRSFMPGWSFPILTTLEKSFAIGMKNLAMFAKIVVCKT